MSLRQLLSSDSLTLVDSLSDAMFAELPESEQQQFYAYKLEQTGLTHASAWGYARSDNGLQMSTSDSASDPKEYIAEFKQWKQDHFSVGKSPAKLKHRGSISNTEPEEDFRSDSLSIAQLKILDCKLAQLTLSAWLSLVNALTRFSSVEEQKQFYQERFSQLELPYATAWRYEVTIDRQLLMMTTSGSRFGLNQIARDFTQWADQYEGLSVQPSFSAIDDQNQSMSYFLPRDALLAIDRGPLKKQKLTEAKHDSTELSTHEEIKDQFEAAMNCRPVSVTIAGGFMDVIWSDSTSTLYSPQDYQNEICEKNKSNLESVKKDFNAYLKRVTPQKPSCCPRLFSKSYWLMSPQEKYDAVLPLCNILNGQGIYSSMSDAQKIIEFRKNFTKQVADTLCKNRDGWGLYLVKRAAALFTCGLVVWDKKSEGEKIVIDTNQRFSIRN